MNDRWMAAGEIVQAQQFQGKAAAPWVSVGITERMKAPQCWSEAQYPHSQLELKFLLSFFIQ